MCVCLLFFVYILGAMSVQSAYEYSVIILVLLFSQLASLSPLQSDSQEVVDSLKHRIEYLESRLEKVHTCDYFTLVYK